MRERRGSSTWPSLVVRAEGGIVLGGVNKELETVISDVDVGGSMTPEANQDETVSWYEGDRDSVASCS